MSLRNESLSWQFDSKDLYVPIAYEGTVVGYGKPKFAARVVDALNEEDRFSKALQLACFDLLKNSGGDPNRIPDLMRKYLAKAERPKYGTAAIAALLRDRQEGIDIGDEEFAKFCDSYRLSREELKDIHEGKDIADHQLLPLSRILGTSVEELTEIRDGSRSMGNR